MHHVYKAWGPEDVYVVEVRREASSLTDEECISHRFLEVQMAQKE